MLRNEVSKMKCEKLDLARQNVVSLTSYPFFIFPSPLSPLSSPPLTWPFLLYSPLFCSISHNSLPLRHSCYRERAEAWRTEPISRPLNYTKPAVKSRASAHYSPVKTFLSMTSGTSARLRIERAKWYHQERDKEMSPPRTNVKAACLGTDAKTCPPGCLHVCPPGCLTETNTTVCLFETDAIHHPHRSPQESPIVSQDYSRFNFNVARQGICFRQWGLKLSLRKATSPHKLKSIYCRH